jgi:hypothetical protein
MTNTKLKNNIRNVLAILFFFIIGSACTEDNSTLAPYVGPPEMSNITLESGSTTPRINWVGGYVTVMGINTGSNPALDSTLIWLIYQAGDQIRYPVKYGQLPAGAQELTTDYGGTFLPELVEDNSYSFWVMKESDWNQISSNQNKYLNLDTLITSIEIDGDTINIPQDNYTQLIAPLDNYINIKDIVPRGRLADLFVEQPTTDNNPIISWQIKQTGVTDTLIAVIGICASGQFDPGSLVWEVYSSIDSGGITYFGKNNVIPGPLKTGDQFAQTFVFTEYPEDGLERDKTYFLYIANKDWNGEDYDRAADYFCYVIFNTY